MLAAHDLYGFGTSERDGHLIVQRQATKVLVLEFRAAALIVGVNVHPEYVQTATRTDERVPALVNRNAVTKVLEHGGAKATEVPAGGKLFWVHCLTDPRRTISHTFGSDPQLSPR
jgi:hypothetical protein